MGSKQKAPKQTETALSKESLEITRAHEALFQELAVPIIRDLVAQTGGEGLTAPIAQQQIGTTNRAFEQAQRGLLQNLARRGLSGSGVAGTSLAKLESARARTVSETLGQARLSNFQQRSQLFSQLSSIAPRPVTTGAATIAR